MFRIRVVEENQAQGAARSIYEEMITAQAEILMVRIQLWKLLRFALLLFCAVAVGGWDFSRHNVPLGEIHKGGPPKDGIPALLTPKFISAREAGRKLLEPGDRVLGFFWKGVAKAYPVKILNWHEIVNDDFSGNPVVVTFCPLCGTGMVFDSVGESGPLTFGVSGLLYQSDMLMYDHKTESLWSQIKAEAIAGPLTGTRLRQLPSVHTTWKGWRAKYPDTLVLSDKTGYSRDYRRDPYEGYWASSDILFPVNNHSAKFHPKETVLGVVIDGIAKAYPFSALQKAKEGFKDRVGNSTIYVHFDKESQSAVIRNENGQEIPSVRGFWFAWFAFNPNTIIYEASDN